MAGDIDANTAKGRWEKYFGNIPAGPPVGIKNVGWRKMTGTHRQWCRTPRYAGADLTGVEYSGVRQLGQLYLDLVSDSLTTGQLRDFYKRLIYTSKSRPDAAGFVDLLRVAGSSSECRPPRGPGQGRAGREGLDESCAIFEGRADVRQSAAV